MTRMVLIKIFLIRGLNMDTHSLSSMSILWFFFYTGYQAVSKNKVNLASALYSIGKDEDESWLVWRTF